MMPTVYAQQPQSDSELGREVFEISRLLRCPTCRAESVSESSAPISIEMREIINEQLAEGKSRQEILAFFQARYGDWILLEPPRRGFHLVVWIMPIVGGIVALAFLIIFLRRWQRNANVPVEVSERDLEQLRKVMNNQVINEQPTQDLGTP
ncbi:MAG: cytochrome c-type biogenesis protein [Deinococcota bacterium]